MYEDAQRLKTVIHQVIDLCKELEQRREVFYPFYHEANENIDLVPEHVKAPLFKTKEKLSYILEQLSVQDLIILRCVHDIGRNERGYRSYTYKQEIETIVIDIQRTPQELLEFYSKYRIYETKKQLMNYIIQRSSVSQYMIEGTKILNLESCM